MAQKSIEAGRPITVSQRSWFPMMIIALAQIQLAFNVSALQVSIGAIVEEFDTSPSSVGTALVVYSLAVAGFVMLGAKVGKRFGSRIIFQISVIMHGLSMIAIALSTSETIMIQVQAVAGLAAAALVPTLVVMIATHYKGAQQSQALGLLGASQAIAGVLAFLVAGVLGMVVSWRVTFWLIAVISVVVTILSVRLKYIEPQRQVKIDWVGALLAALAITLISLGFNNIKAWGMLLASPDAPFSVLGMSLSPIMILLGVFLGQAFFAWAKQREANKKTPLLAIEVLDTPKERSATFSLLIIGAIGPAINFLIPLYIQIVQGRTSLATAIAVIPYSLSIFAATALVVRLFGRLTPSRIGRFGFLIVSIGLVLLAYTIQNEWGTPLVILSLVVIGIGEGALLTLLFNVLVSASPKELAGDVGALRGTVNNLSTGLGTALATVLSATLLSIIVVNSLIRNPVVQPEVIEEQINLDNIDFVSNEQLDEVLEEKDLTPVEENAVININTEARLRALKLSFLILAGIAMLAIFPVGGLPDYIPEEIPDVSK